MSVMKTAILSGIATFAVAVHANNIYCNVEHPMNSASDGLGTTFDQAFVGPIPELCREGANNLAKVLSLQVGDATVEIIPQSEDGTILSLQECKTAFEKIVSQCFVKEKTWGGEFMTEHFLFDIHHTELRKRDIDNIGVYDDDLDDGGLDFDFDAFGLEERSVVDETKESPDDDLDLDDVLDKRGKLYGNREDDLEEGEEEHHDLEVRRGRGGGSRKSHPRPSKPKVKPKPKKKSNSKPKAKPSPKPKPTSKHASKTSSHKPTSTPKSKPAKSCAVLRKQVAVELSTAAKRSDDVYVDKTGSMSLLAKRTSSKSTDGCGVAIFANNYPSPAEMDRDYPNALAYGYTQPNVCPNLQFDSMPAYRRVSSFDRRTPVVYEIEHILEWNTVTNFFDWLNEERFKGRRWPHPDPNKRARQPTVNFCGFWKEVWNSGPAFQMNGAALTANKHLASKYPSSQHFTKEFVWLQKELNKPAKTEMWKRKSTPGIFSDLTLRTRLDQTTNVVNARKGALMLKYLLGAQMYMTDRKIANIFAQQKNRVGKVLGQIDRDLPNHQRIVASRQLDPWETIGLQQLWNQYMDEVFAKAKSRTLYTMDKWVRVAEQRWGRGRIPQNDPHRNDKTQLQNAVRAVARKWKVQKRDFTKPINW
ncbi:hypothetical protein SLS60_002646 [Paraconiothyrium brasiliense]|uniref:Uncharacterized protein n=1 Tax=Paraconiothyrium brasiliense TaxID=300254 RepID=A0ABR3RTE6_9PLEO